MIEPKGAPEASRQHGYPKMEPHVHLEGTVRAGTLLQIAGRNGIALPAGRLAAARAGAGVMTDSGTGPNAIRISWARLPWPSRIPSGGKPRSVSVHNLRRPAPRAVTRCRILQGQPHHVGPPMTTAVYSIDPDTRAYSAIKVN
jgi:hypothetical protein